jgi:hypothetical protein
LQIFAVARSEEQKMEAPQISAILASIRRVAPPYDLAFLEQIASIDWDGVIKDELKESSEIILRATASAILCSDMHGAERAAYAEALTRIARRIEASSLPSRNEEFRAYFDKYQLRLMELG